LRILSELGAVRLAQLAVFSILRQRVFWTISIPAGSAGARLSLFPDGPGERLSALFYSG
jgi:hypothetical protein